VTDLNCIPLLLQAFRFGADSEFLKQPRVVGVGLIQNLSNYYAYLVVNHPIARAFMDLPLLYNVLWVTSLVNENF
jgi:hypothetical protein